MKPVKYEILIWGARESLNKRREKIHIELTFDVSNGLYGEQYEETLFMLCNETVARYRDL